MKLFLPVRRATLLIPSGPVQDPTRKHLFILLTDPRPDDRLTLLVSISSVNPRIHHDGTCLLFVGDHTFIKRDSYVNFAQARIESVDKLEAGVREGILVPQGTIKGDVFARICRGLMESRFTPQKAKRFYEELYPNAIKLSVTGAVCD
ncbi:hypothetical protein [Candidatus Thiosymbion oneisti]|uniref:hypothetical protein n=1 Tax=Candidatus Thiosymbion oneisti TaxID=589554 RepID=UPI000B7C8318|nr:hypothetical protein [Candidatus Thiosymbion oneisti]